MKFKRKAYAMISMMIVFIMLLAGCGSSSDNTRMFDELFDAYANREHPHDFESMKSLLTQSNYECEIIEDTGDESMSISKRVNVSDEHGDKIYFAFFPDENGEDVLMSMTYVRTESGDQVSFSNTSDSRNPEYDELRIGIEGLEIVSSIEELKTYLFE